jgi:integrase
MMPTTIVAAKAVNSACRDGFAGHNSMPAARSPQTAPTWLLAAPRPLPGELLDRLKAHKPAILAALTKPDPIPSPPHSAIDLSEAVGARWEEFDLEAAIWRIPPERMKKRKEHVVPLPSQAVDLLRRVQGFTGHRGHVFPNRVNRNKPMTDTGLRQALAYLGWSGKYSPHATRTTGSTRLNEMGYPADWIERQLAHIEPNAVRRTYNHAEHLPGRRQMMQAWADYLDGLKNGAEVVPLRPAGVTA